MFPGPQSIKIGKADRTGGKEMGGINPHSSWRFQHPSFQQLENQEGCSQTEKYHLLTRGSD